MLSWRSKGIEASAGAAAAGEEAVSAEGVDGGDVRAAVQLDHGGSIVVEDVGGAGGACSRLQDRRPLTVTSLEERLRR